MLGHLMTWGTRTEVDGGTVVNYEGVVLSRDLGDHLRQGAAFGRATFDRLSGTLDLYAADDQDAPPAASVKLRLQPVADHDDLVTHAPAWRELFEEKLARVLSEGERIVGRTPDDHHDHAQSVRDDLTYWQHELKAFERRVARARAES